MPRLAWFSPMPPARTGVAACSAELVPRLRARHEIDVFVDDALVAAGYRSAHDFLWTHRLQPYDLVVYQLGNSSAHDFMWPYLFRFPGLTVLHDAQLHHARAAALLRQQRPADYRAELAANASDTRPDLAELAVAGFDSHLYYAWPMTRLVTRRSRLTAAHAPLIAAKLRAESPDAAIDTIRLGHGVAVDAGAAARASARVRGRYAIPPDAVLFGLFGGLTPEKRVRQVLEAFAALLPYQPAARVLLAGAPARHYDVRADVAALGLTAHVTITDHLDDDDAFTDAIAACDVSLNLRWPTAREMSGPWLRALAAGRATVTTDLEHLADIPALDPRSWTPVQPGGGAPVTVSIDILDEDHSLRLAMRRLASDAALRAELGRAAASYWARAHSVEGMQEDYERLIERALDAPSPSPELPAHLTADGTERLVELLGSLELRSTIW